MLVRCIDRIWYVMVWYGMVGNNRIWYERVGCQPLSRISARSAFHFKSHQCLAVLRPHSTGTVSVHLLVQLQGEGWIGGVIKGVRGVRRDAKAP